MYPLLDRVVLYTFGVTGGVLAGLAGDSALQSVQGTLAGAELLLGTGANLRRFWPEAGDGPWQISGARVDNTLIKLKRYCGVRK